MKKKFRPATLRKRTRPGTRMSADRPGAGDARLHAKKVCDECGEATEFLRYACPSCGSAKFMVESKEDQQFIEEHQRRASQHVDRGGLLFQQGRHADAEAEFRKAIEINPWNATAHGNIGVILLRSGRPREAISWFEKALELNPRVPGGRECLEKARELAGG